MMNMCCLFGLLDYNGVFSSKEKNTILSVLSTECMARGIDATGIAYNANGRLSVFKRPLPADRLRYAVPNAVRYIAGHTRMTTQGSEKRNYNNHPFIGNISSCKFALCHNGVLYNDIKLRKTEALPPTKIQTDSFIAVQLIEKQNALNFGSLAKMAEKVEGSFTFTVLDNKDNLYVIRGSNPFSLYHFRKQGFYIYASTDEILVKALIKLGIQNFPHKNIALSHGDILKIDRRGKIKRGSFNAIELYDDWSFVRNAVVRKQRALPHNGIYSGYIEELKSVASFYGYSTDDIEDLLADGFSCEEIEEMLWNPYRNSNSIERMDCFGL